MIRQLPLALLSFSFLAEIAAASSPEYGYYNMLGTNPPLTPPIQEITGPFRIKVKVRFDDLTTSAGSENVLQFGNHPTWNDEIYFGKLGAPYIDYVAFQYDVSGTPYAVWAQLQATDVNQLIEWEIGVDENLNQYISKNGVVETQASVAAAPNHVNRTIHNLGAAGELPTEHFDGFIADLEVRNLVPASPRSIHSTRTRNLPGQLFKAATPFELYFYARFEDDLGLLSGQTLFEFSAGVNVDRISMYQVGNSSDVRFEIYQGGNSYSVTALNSIVVNEYGLWQAGVNSLGEMWIKKNYVEYDRVAHSIYPTGRFRSSLLFGESLDMSSSDPFRGILVGFRLDTGSAS